MQTNAGRIESNGVCGTPVHGMVGTLLLSSCRCYHCYDGMMIARDSFRLAHPSRNTTDVKLEQRENKQQHQQAEQVR